MWREKVDMKSWKSLVNLDEKDRLDELEQSKIHGPDTKRTYFDLERPLNAVRNLH